MDISRWSEAEIMQLPDHLFGKRWMIGCAEIIQDGLVHFAITMAPLPEWTVFWRYRLHDSSAELALIHTSLRLGDHLPATDAEFYELELLFPQGNRLAQSDFVHYAQKDEGFDMTMRDLKKTSGRRIIMRNLRVAGAALHVIMANFEISSVPRSLPEWFH